MNDSPTSSGLGPHDNPLGGALRFIIEVVAWVAGPWAVAEATGQVWTAVIAAVVLIGLPAVFSTPGDKHQVIVAIPGPVRLVIELVMAAAAIGAAWYVWPTWAAGGVVAVALAWLVAGRDRALWLARGAPL